MSASVFHDLLGHWVLCFWYGFFCVGLWLMFSVVLGLLLTFFVLSIWGLQIFFVVWCFCCWFWPTVEGFFCLVWGLWMLHVFFCFGSIECSFLLFCSNEWYFCYSGCCLGLWLIFGVVLSLWLILFGIFYYFSWTAHSSDMSFFQIWLKKYDMKKICLKSASSKIGFCLSITLYSL